jgi:hypothetical protein
MKSIYHKEITGKALRPHFSGKALKEIVRANILQDRIQYQLGHDHIHFDNSAFSASFKYLAQQKVHLKSSILGGDYTEARKALGRMTHSWQDFYSHSNYVKLWLEQYGWHAPGMITANDPDIINHPWLKSGKIYGILEFAAMLPGFSWFLAGLMPEDSHARMNLDRPKAGRLFPYAYQAALKRTRLVFQEIQNWFQSVELDADVRTRFFDKECDK